MDLYKYKNALGEPNKGIHSYRVFGLAIFDILLTIIAALLISFLFKISFIYTCIFLFISGILFHRLFCVKSTIDKLLFPN
jgi:hypothetical protein